MKRHSVGTGRWLATQVVVSVAAAGCVAALFSVRLASPETSPVAAVDTAKSAQRIADGAVETTVLRYDPQQQAALASIARFTPIAGPAPSPLVARANAPRTVSVLPPPRPTMVDTTADRTVVAAGAAKPLAATPAGKPVEDWRVVGIDIPGSAHVRKYVPTGDDILKTSGAAWTASANAMRKVATLGGLF